MSPKTKFLLRGFAAWMIGLIATRMILDSLIAQQVGGGLDFALGVVLLWLAIARIHPRPPAAPRTQTPWAYIFASVSGLAGLSLVVVESLYPLEGPARMDDYLIGGVLIWLATRIWPWKQAAPAPEVVE